MIRIGAGTLLGGLFALAATVASAQDAPKDFTLPAVNGDKPFVLSEHKGRTVALHFLLKTECPVCLRHTNEYHTKAPTLAGVDQVFIKPDSLEDIQKWLTKTEAGGPTIYRDENATLAKSFNIPDGYEFHGEVVHYPALIILDGEGREIFRYIGKNNSDRYKWDAFAEQAATAQEPAPLGHYNLKGAVPGIKGYDPVAYYKGAPAKGQETLTSKWRGVTYRFSSAENRTAFNANPTAYEPTYGGWCATAIADGSKVDIDPTNYKVTNGRLFLFYKGWLGDAKKTWDKDEANLTPKADQQWKTISAK